MLADAKTIYIDKVTKRYFFLSEEFFSCREKKCLSARKNNLTARKYFFKFIF